MAFLTDKGELRTEPFDRSPCVNSTLDSISDDSIEWFINRAIAERNFPLTKNDGKEKILTHLNLLNNGFPTNAAILLFRKEPQRYFSTSQIKCAHFHGTIVEKPIPFYQIYKGNLFELVNKSVDFVLSKIDLAIGTREKSIEVPTAYEIPIEVIKEAIVNAIAHRDYDSTASVQVMLFKDRLEIRNPGQLPPQLSINDLKKDHTSYPKNPLIADAFYYTHFIEQMGTGIQDMIHRCIEYGLPEPKFEIQDSFVAIIYRKQGIAFEKVGGENTTEKVTEKVTEKQQIIIENMLKNPYISSEELATIIKISLRKTKENIAKLKAKGFIERIGHDKGGHWKVIK